MRDFIRTLLRAGKREVNPRRVVLYVKINLILTKAYDHYDGAK